VRTRIQRAADRLATLRALADRAARRRLDVSRARLERIGSLLRPQAILQQQRRGAVRAAELGERLDQAARNQIAGRARVLASLSQMLGSLSHRSVLERGFAIVRGEGGVMLRTASQVAADAALDIEFADGHIAAQAAGASGTSPPGRSSGAKPRIGAKQGSLF